MGRNTPLRRRRNGVLRPTDAASGDATGRRVAALWLTQHAVPRARIAASCVNKPIYGSQRAVIAGA